MVVNKKKMEKFKVNCKNCGSDKIQLSLEKDGGYSNWTVMSDGKVAFKCHGCGKYGSTLDYERPNELSNFNVRCLKCDEIDNWDHSIQDVDENRGPTNITCKKCGNQQEQE
jgi:transcription elongation factor Elf1